MAKIIEDVLVIKFSKIVRDNDTDPDPILSGDNAKALEAVAQELVGDAVVIEMAYQ